MLNLNFELDELHIDDLANIPKDDIDAVSLSDIAIIGMDAKVGSAKTGEEIWKALVEGLDMITEIPETRRKDAEIFAMATKGRAVVDFLQKAYLDSIYEFDPGVFKMAPIEAEIMDPAQRLFLESAWSALEDAGYGGERMYGTRTGVYVGYNSLGAQYKDMLIDVSKEAMGVIVSGNVNSFIASKLSYILNLRGPALVIDTACSSSLVALHEACAALRRGIIDTAVVGSVRVFVCPERIDEGIGTTSSSERTKAFDEKADGTGGGEGVINFVLKPLKGTIKDGDHIYGVIKGSGVNQDGSSIGITAPNSKAQEEVIVDAWLDAGIDAESISYIEAHGTATKLGDPVELGGLTAAFGRFTKKKQFCAVGAAKTVFGHLDCASGLLGILKVLLMMEHQTIPPTIHFNTPNRKIDYMDSPVYINDTCRPWVAEDGVLNAGVSSFGLSGTNCHVVVQSYKNDTGDSSECSDFNIFAASARDKETLREIVASYYEFLSAHRDIDFTSFCYTVNTGRTQNTTHRFAIAVHDIEDFISLDIEQLIGNAYCSEIRISRGAEKSSATCMNEKDQKQLTEKVSKVIAEKNLIELAALYLQGAVVNFALLYDGNKAKKISAPTYPFRKRRCLYKTKKKSKIQKTFLESKIFHPLLDCCCFETDGLRAFSKNISVENCMELREHCINGVNIMPGTVYVEMMHAIGCDLFKTRDFVFEEITFLSLMSCRAAEHRLLHAVAEECKDELSICIQSCNADGVWIKHATGTLRSKKLSHFVRRVELNAMIAEYPQPFGQEAISNQEGEGFVQLGEHWRGAQRIYLGVDSMILEADISEELKAEIGEYELYPPILDCAVNAGVSLLEGRYLPLCYKNAFFIKPLRGKLFSKITRKQQHSERDELALFKIELFDEFGELVGEIGEYALKRVNEPNTFLRDGAGHREALHTIEWIPDENEGGKPDSERAERAVVLLSHGQTDSDLIRSIEDHYSKVKLIVGCEDKSITGETVCCSEADFDRELQKLQSSGKTVFINLLAYAADADDICGDVKRKLEYSFYFLKAISRQQAVSSNVLVTVVLEASGINGTETCNAMNQALVGFTSSFALENQDLCVRVFDVDIGENVDLLVKEFECESDKLVIGYRKGQRYVERLVSTLTYEEPIKLKSGDVVVIAGGYGGIGLALSRHLFETTPGIRIILLSRSGCSDDTADPRWLLLNEITDEGFSIEVVQADVTHRQQVFAALNDIRKKHGHIDGVIMAAGIAGEGILINKTWETAAAVLAPKIYGAWNLDCATLDDHLKFFIMFSSLTSVFGSPGQTDYSAANAYLDSFVHKRAHGSGKTMTVNWTGWKQSGMAYNYHVDDKDSLFKFVTNEEGGQLFDRALCTGIRRVLAGEFGGNLSAKKYAELEKRIVLPRELLSTNEEEPEKVRNEKIPVIYGKSQDELTEVEKNIALSWARTLLIDELNIYEKFFEVGGNSLLASSLQKEINCIYPNAMTITDMFAYSTVEEMASYVSEKLGLVDAHAKPDDSSLDEIDDLLQQFMDGELSFEEIEKLV